MDSTRLITAMVAHNTLAPARLLPVASALLLATASTADFIGWQTEAIMLPSGRYAMNIYAGFSNSQDRVQFVYDVALTTSAFNGFYQSPEHPFWQPGIQNKLTSDDSWVTIGTHPNGNGNSAGSTITPVPEFMNFDDGNGATDFSFIDGGRDGAGWYNNNPQSAWGYANVGQNRVLLAHIVVTHNSLVRWSATMQVRLANGSIQIVGTGTVIGHPLHNDWDHDGVLDVNDNCVGIFNPDQVDCNGDGIGDACEIAAGIAVDANGNGVPDACECTGDATGDGIVDGADLGALLAAWGAATPGESADFNNDGTVDGNDLGALLSAWGPCPA